ncbi:MAG: ABC transporter permease, partial [Acidobacteriaceae bacterium]
MNLSGLVQDLRYSWRQLRRSPGFTLAAVLTLALGIGANTAVFTLVETVLLAPLKYHDAERIVALNTRFDAKARQINRMTAGDLNDLRAQASDFPSISYYYGGEIGVQLRDHAAFTDVEFTNAEFARVFSLQPSYG